MQPVIIFVMDMSYTKRKSHFLELGFLCFLFHELLCFTTSSDINTKDSSLLLTFYFFVYN